MTTDQRRGMYQFFAGVLLMVAGIVVLLVGVTLVVGS